MSMGRAAVREKMDEISEKMKMKQATAKEEGTFTSLQVINEMMARGVEILPIDIYKSTANRYVIEDGKIRLPYSSLKGVGEAAAEQLEAACENGTDFISVEDFQKSSGVSSAVIESLYNAGALGDMPKENQISLLG